MLCYRQLLHESAVRDLQRVPLCACTCHCVCVIVYACVRVCVCVYTCEFACVPVKNIHVCKVSLHYLNGKTRHPKNVIFRVPMCFWVEWIFVMFEPCTIISCQFFGSGLPQNVPKNKIFEATCLKYCSVGHNQGQKSKEFEP